MAGAGVFDIELNDEVDQLDNSDSSDEEPITGKEDNVRVSDTE